MDIKQLTKRIVADLDPACRAKFDIGLDDFLAKCEYSDIDGYSYIDLFELVEDYCYNDLIGEQPQMVIDDSIELSERTYSIADCYDQRFFEFWSENYYHANGEYMEDLLEQDKGAYFLSYIINQTAELLTEHLASQYQAKGTEQGKAIVAKLREFASEYLCDLDYIHTVQPIACNDPQC